MQYRTLGRTGLRVSVVGLGTMVHAGHFGPMKDSESLSAIDAAFELGVNFIDTSDAYGAGYSEALLGKALRGRRDKIILATKGGNVMVGPDRGKRNFASVYIARVLEESLKRLQTDCIDLYQLHNPTVDVIEHGEAWEVLGRAKKEGKIRYYAFPSTPSTKASPRLKTGGPTRSSSSIIFWPKSRRKRFSSRTGGQRRHYRPHTAAPRSAHRENDHGR